MAVWGARGLNEMPPLWMLKYLPNMPACHATIIYDIQGPSNTQIPGDTAGAVALAEALRIIRRGAADVMVVGGSEAKVNPLSLSRFNLFAQLSRRNDDPERRDPPVRPRPATAPLPARGQRSSRSKGSSTPEGPRREDLSARWSAVASGVDRGSTGPGLAKVIRNALDRAGIQPADVDHVNAHGTGHDQAATRSRRAASREVFGRDMPVFAPLVALRQYRRGVRR